MKRREFLKIVPMSAAMSSFPSVVFDGVSGDHVTSIDELVGYANFLFSPADPSVWGSVIWGNSAVYELGYRWANNDTTPDGEVIARMCQVYANALRTRYDEGKRYIFWRAKPRWFKDRFFESNVLDGKLVFRASII